MRGKLSPGPGDGDNSDSAKPTLVAMEKSILDMHFRVKGDPPANVGDSRDLGSIPGLERSPGGGHGNPLQYSCLKNSTDRGSWPATVQRLANNLFTRTHTSKNQSKQ